MAGYLDFLQRLVSGLRTPAEVRRHLRYLVAMSVARGYARGFPANVSREREPPRARPENQLRRFFENRVEGPGIWKWEHYFDIYERHLSRFVGRSVNVVEVGVYSGGSLDMWLEYFGSRCKVHGVDIEPACRVYQRENVDIHIGDQADRGFWRDFKARVPEIDVLIDDGGHEPRQQIITLEEMLPHLQPGGVFLCEDVHGQHNGFFSYVSGLMAELNAFSEKPAPTLQSEASPFQRAIRSVSVYPYLVVIERNETAAADFVAPKHGTRWQPFL